MAHRPDDKFVSNSALFSSPDPCADRQLVDAQTPLTSAGEGARFELMQGDTHNYRASPAQSSGESAPLSRAHLGLIRLLAKQAAKDYLARIQPTEIES